MLLEKFGKLFKKSKPPIVIDTPWGPVSEVARKQAAMNMKHDPEKKAMVVRMIGEDEARRRYPEGWE